MKPRVSPRDIELLSQYLDHQLKPSKRTWLESRLKDEPALREALDDLRKTRQILRSMPRKRAPHNFTLSFPQVPVRPVSGLAPVLRWVSLTASLVLILVLGGDLLGFFMPARLAQISAPAAREVGDTYEQPVAGEPENVMEVSKSMPSTREASRTEEKAEVSLYAAPGTAPVQAPAPANLVELDQAKEVLPEMEILEPEPVLEVELPVQSLSASAGVSGTTTMTTTTLMKVQPSPTTPASMPPSLTATPSPTDTASLLESGEAVTPESETKVREGGTPVVIEPEDRLMDQTAPSEEAQRHLPVGRWVLWLVEGFLALTAIGAGIASVLLRRRGVY